MGAVLQFDLFSFFNKNVWYFSFQVFPFPGEYIYREKMTLNAFCILTKKSFNGILNIVYFLGISWCEVQNQPTLLKWLHNNDDIASIFVQISTEYKEDVRHVHITYNLNSMYINLNIDISLCKINHKI